jgi:hypothetical protein
MSWINLTTPITQNTRESIIHYCIKTEAINVKITNHIIKTLFVEFVIVSLTKQY